MIRTSVCVPRAHTQRDGSVTNASTAHTATLTDTRMTQVCVSHVHVQRSEQSWEQEKHVIQ